MDLTKAFEILIEDLKEHETKGDSEIVKAINLIIDEFHNNSVSKDKIRKRKKELIKIKVIEPDNAFDRMVIDEVIGEFKELLDE